jgi:hypothetical protein
LGPAGSRSIAGRRAPRGGFPSRRLPFRRRGKRRSGRSPSPKCYHRAYLSPFSDRLLCNHRLQNHLGSECLPGKRHGFHVRDAQVALELPLTDPCRANDAHAQHSQGWCFLVRRPSPRQLCAYSTPAAPCARRWGLCSASESIGSGPWLLRRRPSRRSSIRQKTATMKVLRSKRRPPFRFGRFGRYRA